MVVFATQSLIKDPPFSKIDLISCRNFLIYLGTHLQKQLIPILHYSLNPGGFLFLGSSESIGPFSDLFSVYNNKWKMFKPKSVSTLHLGAMDLPTVQTINTVVRSPDTEFAEKGEKTLSDITEKLLLQSYTPACVIISENGDIHYIHGRTGKYLEPSPGKARLNIYDMAREGLRLELQSGIRRVIAKKTDSYIENLQVKTNGGISAVNVTMRYISEYSQLKGQIMVVFEDVKTQLQKKRDKGITHKAEKRSDRVTELEFELKSAREQLQTSVEELEASNEELQSTNEELQSANEELQSTNEELETSKEELQSVNEELMTLNAESQGKIEELTQLSNDINNLLSGTEIATVFLDTELNIKRYTPVTNRIINLIKSDVGRPLSDIASTLNDQNMVKDAQEVLKTLVPRESEVKDKSGLWFIVRIMPYRTLENVIEGIIITFAEITEQKRLQAELTDSLNFSQGIVEAVREPLLVLDSDLRVLSANRSFYSTFKVTEKETKNKRIYDLGDKQWNIPKLREFLEKILPTNTILQEFKVEHDFPIIGKKNMLLNARRITLKGRKTENILLAIEDVTNKNEKTTGNRQ
jgi:two-component system CheB/CheR fusion protein